MSEESKNETSVASAETNCGNQDEIPGHKHSSHAEGAHKPTHSHESTHGEQHEHNHGHHHHGHDHAHQHVGHAHPADPDPRFAIVTCSDTRSKKEDTAGEALEVLIREHGWTCQSRVVVTDDVDAIAQAIVDAADRDDIDVVLTCGGTGLSPRDVTPEATRKVCQREVPGIAEGMRAYSLKITNRAMLSRAICAQRLTEAGSTLVINLPGSKKAAKENWEAIADVLPHAVSMSTGAGH